MCGIVGIIKTDETVKKSRSKRYGFRDDVMGKVMRQLLYIDTLRGSHGTGLIGTDGVDFVSYKKALSGSDFIHMPKAKEIMEEADIAMIGHNRYATMGSHNDTNSHPFEHGDLIGVHNGTLRGWNSLPDAERFDVDSDYLYYSLDKFGINKTLEHADGAFTLVFFNKKKNTFNIIRNEERPMVVARCEHEDGEVYIIFASERPMIDLVVSRNSLKVTGTYEIKPHNHYELSLGGKIKDVLNVSEVKKYKAPPVPKKRGKSGWKSWGISNGVSNRYYDLPDRTNTRYLVTEYDRFTPYNVGSDVGKFMVTLKEEGNNLTTKAIKHSVCKTDYNKFITDFEAKGSVITAVTNTPINFKSSDNATPILRFETSGVHTDLVADTDKEVACEFCSMGVSPTEAEDNFDTSGFRVCNDCLPYCLNHTY